MSITQPRRLSWLFNAIVFLSSVATLLPGCVDQPLTVTQQPVALRIVASDSCAATLHDIASAYEESNPWVTIEIETLNSAAALSYLQEGFTDLAALAWIGDSDPMVWSIPFAIDSTAVVVHPDVPLESISLLELREVFRGRIGEWPDGTYIQVVSRESGAGTRDAFEAAVMDGQDATLTAIVMTDNSRVQDYVASTPGAIGYVSSGALTSDARVLPVAGILPSVTSADNYPLTYPLFLATLSEPSGEARSFIQWVLQAEGQTVVSSRFALPTPQE
jgi:phosphate transport system substrate-binding protein